MTASEVERANVFIKGSPTFNAEESYTNEYTHNFKMGLKRVSDIFSHRRARGSESNIGIAALGMRGVRNRVDMSSAEIHNQSVDSSDTTQLKHSLSRRNESVRSINSSLAPSLKKMVNYADLQAIHKKIDLGEIDLEH